MSGITDQDRANYKMFDKTGAEVTNQSKLPSGTTLKDSFGSSFVIARKDDPVPRVTKTVAEKGGPSFV